MSKPRQRRRSRRSYVLEAVVVVVAIWFLLTILLPWAGDQLARDAQEHFLPSPSAEVQ